MREMGKSIQLSLFVKHSPQINWRAICVEMDKRINDNSNANYSTWFKPWAMESKYGNRNHLNGL
jgi:hypothetical protein